MGPEVRDPREDGASRNTTARVAVASALLIAIIAAAALMFTGDGGDAARPRPADPARCALPQPHALHGEPPLRRADPRRPAARALPRGQLQAGHHARLPRGRPRG